MILIMLVYMWRKGFDNLPKRYRVTDMADDFDTAMVIVADTLRDLGREYPDRLIFIPEWHLRERADIGY